MISGELESPDVETKPFSNSILHKTEDQNNPTSRAPGYSPPHLEERTPRKTLTVVNADGELEEVKLKTYFLKEHSKTTWTTKGEGGLVKCPCYLSIPMK